MVVRCTLFVIIMLTVIMPCTFGEAVSVASLQELGTALQTAGAGTVISISATGELDWPITVTRSGSEDNPLTIQAVEPEATTFVLEEPLLLKECSHVEVRGMHFRQCKNGALCFDRTTQCRATECRFTECTGKDMVRFMGAGRGNRLDHCIFSGNAVRNLSIRVSGDTPIATRIDHNVFEDVPPIGGNGRETIQIGQNQRQYGQVDVGAIVEFNEFRRCNGEGEIISNKSSGNTYHHNDFIECKGELVMRGGADCVITHNRFERCYGGIRLSGNGHEVTHNVVWASRNTGIRLLYGMSDEPPAFYPAVYDCLLANNTIVGARKAGIFIGSCRGQDFSNREKMASDPEKYGENLVQNVAPHDNRFVNNIVVGEEGALIKIDGAPDNIIERTLLYATRDAKITETGEDAILADPEFVNPEEGDFRLKPESPARGTGKDWLNRGHAPDIGAGVPAEMQ
ncbi:MAG: chondroitinase-B domain-containing protein [Candidatus Hydrogenedentota bacterium]